MTSNFKLRIFLITFKFKINICIWTNIKRYKITVKTIKIKINFPICFRFSFHMIANFKLRMLFIIFHFKVNICILVDINRLHFGCFMAFIMVFLSYYWLSPNIGVLLTGNFNPVLLNNSFEESVIVPLVFVSLAFLLFFSRFLPFLHYSLMQ